MIVLNFGPGACGKGVDHLKLEHSDESQDRAIHRALLRHQSPQGI